MRSRRAAPSEVHADTLIAHYREAQRRRQYRRQHRNLPGRGRRPRHDQARQPDRRRRPRRSTMSTRQIGIVTGKGLKLTTATDIVTARDSLEWYDQKQIAVARGDAVAIRNGKTIKADVLTAYMVKTRRSRPAGQAGASRQAARRPSRRRAGQAAARPAAAARRRHRRSRRSAGSTPRAMSSSSTRTDIGRGDYGVYNAETGIVHAARQCRRSPAARTSSRGQYARDGSQQQHQPHDAGAGAARQHAPQRVAGPVRAQEQPAGPAPTSPLPAKPPAASRRRRRKPAPREEAVMRRSDGRPHCDRRPGSAARGPAAAARRRQPAAWSGAGSARASSGGRCCATSTSRCSAARWSGCSGPNGAGKTTCFYIITGLIAADTGTVEPRRRRTSPTCRCTAAPASASAICRRRPRSFAA